MITSVAANINPLAFGKAPNGKANGKASNGLMSHALPLNNSRQAPSALGGQGHDFFSNLIMFEKKLTNSIVTQTNKNLDQDRKLAMTIFLQKMQKEFGVKPAQILKAFSHLSAHDLSLPPEDSAAKFISELKLSDKDAHKARDIYSKMLGILSNIDVMQNRMAKVGGEKLGGAQVSAQAAAQAQFMPQQTNSQQVKTQQQVAMIPKAVSSSLKSAATVATMASPATSNAVSAAAMPAASESTVSSAANASTPNASMATIQAANSKPTQAVPLKAPPSNAATKVAATKVATRAAATQIATAQTAGAKTVQTTGQVATTAAVAAAIAAHTRSYGANDDGSGSQSNGGAANGQHKQNNANTVTSAQQNLMAPTSTANSTVATNPMPSALAAKHASPLDVKNNVNEIISHAQFLAHKGGGEMNMTLKPEGLGSVHLRVNMRHGKMSVEMLATNNDAKQVLEKGLSELKTSLASQHIHVESILIHTPTELAQQFLSHHQHEMQRGFQQQFLSNFQNQNSANRQALYDFSEPAIPMSQIHDRASNSLYSLASVNKKSNRRLDLVA